MDYKIKQLEIYEPLIKQFKNQTANLKQKLWINKLSGLSGLFIPHVLSNYGCIEEQTKKYFYIGQDTNEWIALDKVYQLSEKKYIEENNEWLCCVNDILERGKKKYDFWNFVVKLHLTLNNIKTELKSLCNSEIKILEQIGWGNLFSLEISSTLKKYNESFSEKHGCKFTDTFDLTVYKELEEKAKKISKLENIIKAFSPDYVIILAWKHIENWYLDGLEYKWLKTSIPDRLCIYQIKNTNTKLLWTYHPQAMCTQGIDPDEMIKLINSLK